MIKLQLSEHFCRATKIFCRATCVPCRVGVTLCCDYFKYMLTLDIVDFIENLNSQLMQLTRFKIQEFKRLFPLLCSARFWGQLGELFLFVLCFPFAHMNNLHLVLRTFIIDKSRQQIFFKLFELTILVVNISISRKKNMLTMVSKGSFFKGLDNKIKGFVHI